MLPRLNTQNEASRKESKQMEELFYWFVGYIVVYFNRKLFEKLSAIFESVKFQVEHFISRL